MGRTKEIKIRMTANEHQTLMQKRGKMRLASWMRESCINTMPPAMPEISVQALRELHRIGSNLNQLARQLNSTGHVDAAEAIAEIKTLRAHLLRSAI